MVVLGMVVLGMVVLGTVGVSSNMIGFIHGKKFVGGNVIHKN
jgi:hypothetical protein